MSVLPEEYSLQLKPLRSLHLRMRSFRIINCEELLCLGLPWYSLLRQLYS